MLGVSPGPALSSGSGLVAAASRKQSASLKSSLGWLRCGAPLQPLALGTVIITRGRSLDSQPSKASQETRELRLAIAREGKLRPRVRNGVIWPRWQPGLCVRKNWACGFLFPGRGQRRLWAGAVTQGHSWESDPKRNLRRPGSRIAPGSSGRNGSPKKHLEGTHPIPAQALQGCPDPRLVAGRGAGREVGVRSWPQTQWGLHGSHAGGGARASGHRCHQPPPCVRQGRQ
jgi:hypothetical protein